MRPPPATASSPNPKAINKKNQNSPTIRTKPKTKFLQSTDLSTPTKVSSDKLSKRLSRVVVGGGGGGEEKDAIIVASSTVVASPPPSTPNAEDATSSSSVMAPALTTEPLSPPTEKLANSTTATSSATTPNTRSTSRHKTTTTTDKLEVVATTSANASASSKENKRNRTVSSTSTSSTTTPTSTSTRVTRSKDAAYQRIFEQAVALPPATSPTSATQNEEISTEKSKKNNSDQMGLSATVNNNNNNNNNSSASKDEVAATTVSAANNNCKDNSTEQLLADLTNDFEEAISADICLRKQLLDVNLGKSDAGADVTTKDANNSANKSSAKDILVIKAKTTSGSVTSPSAPENKLTPSPPMADVIVAAVQSNDLISNELVADDAARKIRSEETVATVAATPTVKERSLSQTLAAEAEDIADVETASVSSTISATSPQKHDCAIASTRAQIISVEELPPISTDSTMTASEVEDNLEERLSQLDGTAVVPLTRDEVAAVAASTGHINQQAQDVNMTIVPQQQQQHHQQSLPPATPPRSSTHQQQIAQLHQQLLLTPPTPTMGGGGTLLPPNTTQSYTPQSGSSSVNTLAACTAGSGSTGAGDELQDGDLEEVLKALKTFDPSNTTGDGLGDLNSLFSDIVYSSLNYDEVGSQQAGTSSSTTSALTTSATAAATVARSPPTSPLKEVHAEIERQQQAMQRKIDFLVRRMHKVQARNMCRQTSEEVAGLFEWSARIANKRVSSGGGVGEMSAPTPQQSLPPPPQVPVISARPPAHNWSDEQRNPVPSAQMSAVLRKLEASANAQQLCTKPSASYATSNSAVAQLKRTKKALAAAALEAMSSSTWPSAANNPSGSATERREGDAEIVVPTFDANIAEEITHVAGLLQSEMREVQNAIDSDATESSSGGESADEMVTYNNQLQQPLSIAKRAAWRYSRDRAAIASRWSWLLSQIADLEIKIRQHSELHQELVRTKGAVISCTLEAAPAASSAKSTSTNVPSSSSALSSGVNGYKGDILLQNSAAGNAAIDVDVDSACRTRGFVASHYRKRKLLQTINVHTVSKKAARTSTVKCGCQWPTLPCGLCTGRVDPTSPRDLPDTMMTTDRVALLDGCYHPVLSFPEDVSNSIQFEAVARQADFQQRIMRCQVKSIAKSVWKAERNAAAAAAGHRHGSSSKRYSGASGGGESTTKRRYIKKKDRIAAEEKAAAAAAALATGLDGNGTGTLSSSTSTTPLVANKSTTKNLTSQKIQQQQQQQHSHLVAGDGVLMEPLSPAATNHSSSQNSQSSSHHMHQRGDYPAPPPPATSHPMQNHHFEQFNPNQTHSSLISNNSSNRNSKHRKLSASATNYHHNNHNHHQHYNNNNQYYHQSSSSLNGGNSSESHFLHTNDNWDAFATRSRTSSPTHGGGGGGSSNYHKYERSLDRKNRSSYDIDNIVIPYSVAAATRVEILPYKEIPTPKWRVIEDDNEESNSDESSPKQSKSAEAEKLDKIIPSNNLSTVAAADNPPAKSTTAATTTDAASTKSAESNDIKMKNISSELKTKNPVADKQKKNNNNNVLKQAATTAKAEQRPCEKKENPEKQDNKATEEPATKKSKIEEKKVTASIDPATSSHEAAKEKHLTNDSNDSDSEDEDISEEASILRHERALTEERRKFQTYLKFPWSTRSRANRRIDSRAESSGANTPDPASPAPNTPSVGGGDQESIPSPLAPSTPLNPLDNISEAGENVLAIAMPPSVPLPATAATSANFFNCINNKRLERRRTTSTKKDREAPTERRSSTPDPRELIPPYEPLQFPLPDEVFDSLLQVMPSEYQDDSKYFEDCFTTISSSVPFTYTNIKNIRHPPPPPTSVRHSLKNDSYATKQRTNSKSTTTNCDAAIIGNGSRKKTLSSTSHKSGSAIDSATAASSASLDLLQYEENGKDDDDDDAAEEAAADEDEEEDDDYPKHHLAPDDSIYDNGVCGSGDGDVGIHENLELDDEYGAYVGRRGRNMLDDSDGESSETEPFQDDDPNDPEWKGESEERSERPRRKL